MTKRELLFDILSFARPHGSRTEKAFCKEFLDTVEGMQKDHFGNRYLRIGTAPLLWSCHVDTVAAKGGAQELAFDRSTGLVSLANGKAGMSLGADDGAGIWLMLNMIEAGIEGLYIFHRGEEVGCLGSRWIVKNEPHRLDGIKAAIAFDRAGTSDVITHQSHGMTASDDFALSMAAALNKHDPDLRYRPDDTGVFTDTNEYAELVPECSNLSVGYHGQHGPRETLDVYHCEKLLSAVLKADFSGLVFAREPGDTGFGQSFYGSGWDRSPALDEPDEELLDVVRRYPEAVARLLDAQRLTAWDVFDYARWEEGACSPVDD